MKYIALLRGINVGGKNIIKMPDLKKSLSLLNFRDIITYLQSGNVIFDYELMNSKELAAKIETTINQTFGFPVMIILRTFDELKKIVNQNPLLQEPNLEPDKLHVTLLSDLPDSNIVSGLDLKKEENERFIISGQEVYLYCPNGYGNTKLNNAIFEKKLNTKATTRNWNTMNKLLELG